jgi:hypothetical protein
MTRQLDASDRVVSAIFLAVNGLLWLALCSRMIMRWHVIAHDLHVWLIELAIITPLLWHSLLKDKSSLSSMTGVSLLFMGVVMVMLSAHLL